MRFLLLLLFAGSVFAQQPGKTWRVGFLATSGPEASDSLVKAFRDHARALRISVPPTVLLRAQVIE